MPSPPPGETIILLFYPSLVQNDNSMVAAMVASWSGESESASTVRLGALALQHEAVDSCLPPHTGERFTVFSPSVSVPPHVDSSDLTVFITCGGLVSFCSGPFGHMHFTLADNIMPFGETTSPAEVQ